MCKRIAFLGLIALFIVNVLNAQDKQPDNGVEKTIDGYLTYFSGDNPGAVITVMKQGDIVFNKAYGLSNVQLKEDNTVSKTYNIPGISKSFTALAIFQLIEKGKLSLDDKVMDILPNFPQYAENVRVKHLLSHTSGIKAYDVDKVKNNLEIISFLENEKELDFEPGTQWAYSNSDYPLLALIIEKVSKMAYPDYMTKYIFRKLSMANTFLANDARGKDMATGHFKENGEYIASDEYSMVFGEQGIYTNSVDFAKWDKALYTNKLLDCEYLSQIFTVFKLPESKLSHYYGYGWVLMQKNGVRYYWHGGSGNGYTNMVLHLPDTKTTVLILSNRNDGYDFLKLAILIAKVLDKNLKL